MFLTFQSVRIPQKVFPMFDTLFFMYLQEEQRKESQQTPFTQKSISKAARFSNRRGYIKYIHMKNLVKWRKHFFWYSPTLEIHRVYLFTLLAKNAMQDHRLKPIHDAMMDQKLPPVATSFFLPVQSHPSLNTQSCIRRHLCRTFRFENLRISPKKKEFFMFSG